MLALPLRRYSPNSNELLSTNFRVKGHYRRKDQAILSHLYVVKVPFWLRMILKLALDDLEIPGLG